MSAASLSGFDKYLGENAVPNFFDSYSLVILRTCTGFFGVCKLQKASDKKLWDENSSHGGKRYCQGANSKVAFFGHSHLPHSHSAVQCTVQCTRHIRNGKKSSVKESPMGLVGICPPLRIIRWFSTEKEDARK